MNKPTNPVDAHLLTEADRSLDAAEANLFRAQDALRFSGALDSDSRLPLPAMTPRVASYRAHLLEQTGNPALADMSVEHLLKQGAQMRVREAERLVERAKLEPEIAAYHNETREQLAALNAEVLRCANATTAAVERLDEVRLAREREFNAGLGARLAEINRELSGPYRPEPKAQWKEWKPGDDPIAVMRFPDGRC